jgi:predicted restriction endonuclease
MASIIKPTVEQYEEAIKNALSPKQIEVLQVVEAAHIKPKHLKGGETLDNIILLCPNHHKEFDLGNTVLINHTKSNIEFSINGKEYNLPFEPAI